MAKRTAPRPTLNAAQINYARDRVQSEARIAIEAAQGLRRQIERSAAYMTQRDKAAAATKALEQLEDAPRRRNWWDSPELKQITLTVDAIVCAGASTHNYASGPHIYTNLDELLNRAVGEHVVKKAKAWANEENETAALKKARELDRKEREKLSNMSLAAVERGNAAAAAIRIKAAETLDELVLGGGDLVKAIADFTKFCKEAVK